MFSDLILFFVNLLQAILGWIIFVPLSFIVPKKRKLVVFIGRDDGRFVDSVKYIFLHYSNKKNDIEFYFLTSNKETNTLLLSKNLSSLYFPSFKSILILLRANIVIVDNWMWILRMKYHMLFNAKKIQIWHGIPLKKIELNDPIQIKQMDNIFYYIKNLLGGKYPNYDLLVSTSDYFTVNSFNKSFKFKHTIESGYPRNDIFFKNDSNTKNNFESEYLINVDKTIVEVINTIKKDSTKLILYAPTFRDTGGDAISDNILNLDELNNFASSNNIIFIFKFHPDPNFEYNLASYNNILFYNNSADIYPLLPLTDALITDYSSIYFDYLLLDKPIIFFPYDMEKYIKMDRQLDFDYDKFTPGPKCYNQKEVILNISNIVIKKNDPYRKHRGKILNISYKHLDGLASERIQKHVRKYYL